ncbi:hypothetical protein [Lysinibacillus pakistanensis]|uniref:Uncharacterized protein n=1 Tax=Lysinibacillus pakistanensis TaxID=759811 RepID=A0ABX6DA40_9BACI|nr:hypothetical protein GDS87_10905 [Lysinibacillus pakistanensis]
MYKEITKTKLEKINFYSLIILSCVIFFLLYFTICVFIHTKYIDDYPIILLGTTFVFLTPPILTILSTYILTLIVFNKHYINKRELSKRRDILAHLSVFTTILINTIGKFYSPDGNNIETEGYNWFLEQTFDFINATIQDVNYVYTLPIIFSMLTLILLALENTKFITRRKRKIMSYPHSYPSINPSDIERAKQIVNEIDTLRKISIRK